MKPGTKKMGIITYLLGEELEIPGSVARMSKKEMEMVDYMTGSGKGCTAWYRHHLLNEHWDVLKLKEPVYIWRKYKLEE